MAKNKYTRLFENTAIFTAGKFISKLIVIFMLPFYTSCLSSAEYSTADLITNLCNLIIPLAGLGVSEGIFRGAAEKNQDKESFFTNGIIIEITITTIEIREIKDIVFSYDKVLNFDGETSVYVQYTCARANSVLQKGGIVTEYEIPELTAEEVELVKAIATFPETVKSAAEKYEPSYIARFAVDVSQKFNKFYFDCKILSAEDEKTKNFRLALTNTTLQSLKNAFALLGIGIPDKM